MCLPPFHILERTIMPSYSLISLLKNGKPKIMVTCQRRNEREKLEILNIEHKENEESESRKETFHRADPTIDRHWSTNLINQTFLTVKLVKNIPPKTSGTKYKDLPSIKLLTLPNQSQCPPKCPIHSGAHQMNDLAWKHLCLVSN